MLCCVVSAGKIIKSATFVKCPESSLVAGLSPHRISSANGSKLSARRPPCQAHESGQLPACILLSTSVMAPPSTPMLPTQARLLSVGMPAAPALPVHFVPVTRMSTMIYALIVLIHMVPSATACCRA